MVMKPIPLVPISGMGDTKYMQQMKRELKLLKQQSDELEIEINAKQKAIKDAEETWKSVESKKSSRKKGGKRISRKKK